MNDDFIINNIGIDVEVYQFNDYIQLKQDEKDKNKTWVCFKEDQQQWYGNQVLFFYALLISIPKIHISLSCREKEDGEKEFSYNLYKNSISFLHSYMFNYYFNIDEDFDNSYIRIYKDDFDKLKYVFDIVVEHSKKCREKMDNKEWEVDRWLIAYSHYLSAYRSLSVELSIQNMVTVLEALLVQGSGELNFRVALFSSLIVEKDIEKRKEVFDLIKYMYDIRSKSVHGEIILANKKLKNFDYNKYYRFKEIVSEVLIKTYGKKEEEIFNALENMIYSSNKFEDYLK